MVYNIYTDCAVTSGSQKRQGTKVAAGSVYQQEKKEVKFNGVASYMHTRVIQGVVDCLTFLVASLREGKGTWGSL